MKYVIMLVYTRLSSNGVPAPTGAIIMHTRGRARTNTHSRVCVYCKNIHTLIGSSNNISSHYILTCIVLAFPVMHIQSWNNNAFIDCNTFVVCFIVSLYCVIVREKNNKRWLGRSS